MKQTIKRNEDGTDRRRLQRRPEWFDAYLHLKYKLVQKPAENYTTLGVMTVEDIQDKVLHKLYDLANTRAAVQELVRQGILSLVYETKEGHTLVEDFSEPVGERTLDRMRSGELFNKETGLRYDIDTLERRFCLSKESLSLDVFSEESADPTPLQRIRNWFKR